MTDILYEKLYSILFLAACHIIALIVFLVILLRLLYLLFRQKNPNRHEKIIATAVTCIIYNVTLNKIVIVPIAILITNLQVLFYRYYVYIELTHLNEEQKVKDTLERQPLNDQVISVTRIFENFPLARFISAVAFAMLLYYIIKYAKQRVLTPPPDRQPADTSALIYNTVISATLLFSLFLVVSVCITIPYFSEVKKPTIFTQARLDSVLSRMSNKDSFKLVVGPSPFLDTPLARVILNGDVAKQHSQLKTNARERIDFFIKDFQNTNNEFKLVRNTAITSLSNYAGKYHDKEEGFKRDISLNFERSLQSLTTDKGSLFQLSINSFNDFVQSEKENFQNNLREINIMDGFNAAKRERAISEIREIIGASFNADSTQGTSDDSLILARLNSTYSMAPLYNNYVSFIGDKYYDTDPRSYNKDGSDWGFFGWIASYLIRTQSSELVLLIGMFGFGLLGASLFSFGKSDSDKNFIELFKTKPLILNFGNVLARGCGAALVVYLATKGGLAIFSAGTSTDANGYILLLACFVGAVFSEKVWNKISVSLYGESNNNGNGKKDDNGNNGESNNNGGKGKKDNNDSNGETNNGEKPKDDDKKEAKEPPEGKPE